MMTGWLTVLLLLVPTAGCLFTLLLPERWATLMGVITTATVLADTVAVIALFHLSGKIQFQVDKPWIPELGSRFHLGLDGISLPLIVLTALLTFLCTAYLMPRASRPERPRAFVALVLLMEVGTLGTFIALDLLLFFVAFELVLVPMYSLIAGWGGSRRRPAANQFILYTLLGSGFLLVGILIVAVQTGTLDMVALTAGSGMNRTVQIIAFLAMAIGFAVKTPMWPLHSWLPDAHTQAPTVGSVLLAGVLLKMGTYGFVRVALPILPDGARLWAPWLGTFAVIGIIYAALACLAQRDLKRLIAFSSVGHMGFVLLGIASLTPIGLNAALFANIAHGLITGLLFFLVGGISQRYHSTELDRLGGGLLAKAPRLGSLLVFASVASLGLPGLAGFWGEMLALQAAFQPAAGLSRGLYLVLMATAGIGAVLTAAAISSPCSTGWRRDRSAHSGEPSESRT
ncbi:complex I subunit 4 family protein [Fodinicola feengrottensis]|uniref:complex I subunit 4 family protein n=1 Tax=Fodinicola feengrottensis TaxID=435914 RepID=UPI0024414B9E|nr:NADH-quinone oxidoreductase subunit M [Fodinicola feengrottensis]